MYNKVKRGLTLTSGILGIVMGAFQAIVAMVVFFYMIPMIASYGAEGAYLVSVYRITGVIFVLLSVAYLALGILLCPEPKKGEDGKYKWRTGVSITFIVFGGLSLLTGIISGESIIIVPVAIFLGIVIASLCVKDNPQKVEEKAGDDDVKNKIEELKKLKDLGVITEEQYDASAKKIFEDYKNTII